MKKLSVLSAIAIVLACCLLAGCGSPEVPQRDVESDLMFYAEDKLDLSLGEISIVRQTAGKDGRESVVECMAVGEAGIAVVDARFKLNYVKSDKGWTAVRIEPIDQKNWEYRPAAPIGADELESAVRTTVKTPYGEIFAAEHTIQAVTIKSRTWDEKNHGTKDSVTAELVLDNGLVTLTVEPTLNFEFRKDAMGNVRWQWLPAVIEIPDAEFAYLPGKEPPAFDDILVPSFYEDRLRGAHPLNMNASDVRLISTDTKACGLASPVDLLGGYLCYEMNAHTGSNLISGDIYAKITYRYTTMTRAWVLDDVQVRIDSLDADGIKGVWTTTQPVTVGIGLPANSTMEINEVRADVATRDITFQGVVTSERVDGSQKGSYSFTATFKASASDEFNLTSIAVLEGDDMRSVPDYGFSNVRMRFDHEQNAIRSRGSINFEKK